MSKRHNSAFKQREQWRPEQQNFGYPNEHAWDDRSGRQDWTPGRNYSGQSQFTGNPSRGMGYPAGWRDDRGYGHGEYGAGQYGSMGYGQNYRPHYADENYGTMGYGQNYRPQNAEQNYGSMGYGQNYRSQYADQNYGAMGYGQNYRPQNAEQNYGSMGYGQNYRPQNAEQNYGSTGYGQNYRPQNAEQNYGSAGYGQNYRTQNLDQHYGSQRSGQNYGGQGSMQNYYGSQRYGQSYGEEGYGEGRGSSIGQDYNSWEVKTGKAPRNYKKSDQRITEDVSESLERAGLDCSGVDVTVKDGVVTLTGEICGRSEKHRAEMIAAGVSGATDVENQLRISKKSDSTGDSASTRSGSGAASDSAASGGTQGTSNKSQFARNSGDSYATPGSSKR